MRAAFVIPALLTACSATGSLPPSVGTGDAAAPVSDGQQPQSTPGLPEAPTAAALDRFLADRAFENSGWFAETETPREEESAVSPHDRVRVFQNAALRDGRDQPELPADSMAVKEIFDGDDSVGFAAMWRVVDDEPFTYFCWGPAGRCGVQETATPREEPMFGVGTEVVCGHCHNDLVFTTW